MRRRPHGLPVRTHPLLVCFSPGRSAQGGGWSHGRGRGGRRRAQQAAQGGAAQKQGHERAGVQVGHADELQVQGQEHQRRPRDAAQDALRGMRARQWAPGGGQRSRASRTAVSTVACRTGRQVPQWRELRP